MSALLDANRRCMLWALNNKESGRFAYSRQQCNLAINFSDSELTDVFIRLISEDNDFSVNGGKLSFTNSTIRRMNTIGMDVFQTYTAQTENIVYLYLQLINNIPSMKSCEEEDVCVYFESKGGFFADIKIILFTQSVRINWSIETKKVYLGKHNARARQYESKLISY